MRRGRNVGAELEPTRRGVKVRVDLLAVVVGLTVAVVLSGCSTSSSTSVPVATPTTAAPPSATTVPVQHPLPSTVPNNLTLRKNVAITACHAVTGGWAAEGTATNPGTSPDNYQITVFFTTPRATVLDYATVAVAVQPGKTAQWTAEQHFATVPGMNCVLRGVS